jgi:hypothetical protein
MKDCIIHDIISYYSLGKWRLRTFEWKMFDINGDMCINPACINESVVSHREITLILSVYK